MEIQTSDQTLFDQMRRTHGNGAEFWSARDLMVVLGYSKWDNFQQAITRAIEACESTVGTSQTHFPAARKMVPIGNGNTREILDYHFTRYAAYLVAMNSDPSKAAVGQAQNYFVQQTRVAEVAQEALALPDDPILAQLQVLAKVRQSQLLLERRTDSVEQATAELQARLDASPITSEKVGVIHKLGQELGAVMGDHRRAWRLFKDRFGLAAYRDLPNDRYEEGQHFLRMQISAYTGRPLAEHWDRA